MHAVKLSGLKKMFVTKTVFENVTAKIAWGEKVAIVGANGVGKTTLFRVITGELTPDAGSVIWDERVSREQIGLLTQQLVCADDLTTREFVRQAKRELLSVEMQLRSIEAELSNSISREINEQELLIRYGALQERFETIGGYSYDSEVERVLREVGLPPDVWELELSMLSGGQKTRAQLAKLLLQEAQIWLLDEPTNHLDEATMDWLEAMIRKFPGTVVTVSHDRYFLDRVATRILELSAVQLASYPGNYTAYEGQKELERRTQQVMYQKQQAEMQHLAELISMYKTWYLRAHDAGGANRERTKGHIRRMRNKEKQLERLQANRVERVKEVRSIRVSFDTTDKLANRLFLLEDVAVKFGERLLYDRVNFAVRRQERLALIGPNGVGKSTLLKVIAGVQRPTAGSVQMSSQVRIGYFGQELESLDLSRSILEEVLAGETLTQTEARTVLAGFLFRGEDVFKKVGELSQGEKCRVAFVKLYFSGANVLVLDEPTNYLDIESRRQMEQALQHFPGALLLVSHDRYLVRRLATSLLHFTSGEVCHFAGGWEEWREHQQRKRLSSQDLQQHEQRMILQMELSRLAAILDDRSTRPEERARATVLLTAVQQELRAMP
ncbi:ribosomal protection-like ABC-F family protein [Tumebacillus lipolyticus]|uniref:Ribosomal protection-like ABC-F family protein n=1 Tax=Tumebacillus lipolyticus TaxID=1280370 RepID=A0ABW5A1R0_9BACL